MYHLMYHLMYPSHVPISCTRRASHHAWNDEAGWLCVCMIPSGRKTKQQCGSALPWPGRRLRGEASEGSSRGAQGSSARYTGAPSRARGRRLLPCRISRIYPSRLKEGPWLISAVRHAPAVLCRRKTWLQPWYGSAPCDVQETSRRRLPRQAFVPGGEGVRGRRDEMSMPHAIVGSYQTRSAGIAAGFQDSRMPGFHESRIGLRRGTRIDSVWQCVPGWFARRSRTLLHLHPHPPRASQTAAGGRRTGGGRA
jgi:hypothetical protein